ncbi:MAG: transcriptional repressor LexA [Bdellovibrionia bacterium]
MPNLTSLSPKQAKVLAFIESEIARTGRPPTYRDIAQGCGYEAVGTVQDHIRALMKKGMLQKERGLARGLQLTHRSCSMDIPILGMVPAGKPTEAFENTLGYLSVPSNLSRLSASSRGSEGPSSLYALKVKGFSMKDAGILEGDYVIVKKQSHAENGEIVVALLDGEATVKIFEKKSHSVRLLPANPEFSPIECSWDAENLIQGKVLSVQRYYGTAAGAP